MKRKNRYYDRYGEISRGYSINQWFKGKDDHYRRWFSNTYLQNDLGIKLRPKHRHKRSFALRTQCLVLGRNSDTGYRFKHKPLRKVGKVYYCYLPHRVYVDHNMDLLFQTE